MFPDLLAARAALVDGRDRTVELPERSLAQPDTDGDAEFFRVNALLLRNSSSLNLLDGCALSLPCHPQDERPVGLMAWAGSLPGNQMLGIALCIESALRRAED